MKKTIAIILSVMLFTTALAGCGATDDLKSMVKAEDAVVVDKNSENANDVNVASNDDYEVKIVGTVYSYSSKRKLLVKIENKTDEDLYFSATNIKVDEVENTMEAGGNDVVKANTKETLPMVFEEWTDFEHCSGEIIITNESSTINNTHEFNIIITNINE
ncbi:hypothetical protein [Clostridium grantii]|uniref:Lipoprotein n=1 Tax=Clostridium grantii DSM 8605 TaxID=1121316 RepID=A0A1M5VKQ0_9CLOT|nr:hypothetical protein [Clostridium grantii]SHH75809.1 hypothetical protein SAMN02745207_02320 [Clostridium grantii DSM 8605]